MTTLVSCILGRKITNSLSSRILSEAQALESTPEVYAVVKLYGPDEELVETISVKSKLDYWRTLGWVFQLPESVTESYVRSKLASNTTQSLREYAYAHHQLVLNSNISIVTNIAGELIIE